MFRKIFSGVWLCSWKYHRKHIFYLLVTFSRLPNEYIITFIPQYRNTNKTQKKNHQIRSHFLTFSQLPNKYIISFIPQYKHKQNPEKKSSNPGQIERKRKREGRLGLTRGYDRRGASWDRDRRGALPDRDGCFARSRSTRSFTIVGLRLAQWLNYCEESEVRWAWRDPEWAESVWVAGSVWVLVVELSSFSRSLFFTRDPEMVWR